MIRRPHVRALVLCLLVWSALFAVPAHSQSNIPDILSKMPAQSAAEGDTNNAELVKLGPDAVKQICAMLVPPGTGDDAKAQFALSGLVKYVTHQVDKGLQPLVPPSADGAESERMMVAKALIDALAAANDREVKAFLISQLQLTGKDESVGPLSAYLNDDRLCEPATQALLAIRTPRVGPTLAKALVKATGPNRVTLIKALGEIPYKRAVKDITKDAMSSDRTARETALFALANIGQPKSEALLTKAIDAASSSSERAAVTADYLLFAKRLAEAGKKKQSEAIFRGLLKNRKETYAQSAALSGIVSLKGAAALGDLLAAMDSENGEVRGVALQLAASISGEDATKQWVGKMVHASPEVRAEILYMLGERGDKTALASVLEALKDKDKTVRVTAANAATRLGGPDALSALIEMLKCATEADEIKIAKEALLRVPGDQWPGAVVAALPSMTPPVRKALLEILAARRAKTQLEPVFAQTKDADESIRVAAINALENLASETDLPRLIDLASSVVTDAERGAAQKVVVSIAKQTAATERHADAILAALSGASSEKKIRLLPTLAGVGGRRALETVVAESKSKDAATQDAAIRALADWPDAVAIPELLRVVKASKQETQQVLALRGFARLVGVSNAPPDQKLKLYATAMGIVRRVDDKKLLLASVADVRSLDALKYVAKFLDDKTLQTDAALAAVRIACPQNDKDKGLCVPEAAPILKKAVAYAADAEARKKVEAFIATIP